jgi:RHS repeat-associated protein
VAYTHDPLARQIEVVQDFDGDAGTMSGQRVTTNAYDEFGRVIEVDAPEGTVHHEYDNVGRVTRTYTGDFDADGMNVAADNQEITDTRYTYDVLGRLETVTVVERNDEPLGTAEVTSYAYDNVGNLDTVSLPNGVVSDYDYDAMNRLTDLTHTDTATSTVLASYTYELLTDGKRKSETDTVAGTTFDWVYDDIGRLISESYDGPGTVDDYSAEYFFDLASNRVRKELDQGNDTTVDEVIEYFYDDNDRLLSEALDSNNDSIIDQTTVYEYGDSNDRTEQTRKTVWQGVDTGPTGTKLSETTYEFNLQGRMSQVAVDSDGNGSPDTTSTYEYNDSGIRVSQAADDGTTVETTNYVIDSNNHTGYAQVLEERNALTGVVAKTFTLGLDVIAQQAPAVQSGDALTLLYDGHGSTRALIDAQLALAQKYLYDAYGNMFPGAGLTTDPATALTSLLYSGEKTDPTGLQYLRSRYYNPATGRFNRLDPFAGNSRGPLSLHKYLYTHANPVMGVDPSGDLLVTTLTASSLMASIAVSALLTIRAVQLIDRLQPTALERLATDLNTKVITHVELERRVRDEPGQYFIHGGTAIRWRGATGIKITKRPDNLLGNDFGDGFYTYRADISGIEAASRLARSRASIPIIGGEPFLLLVKVDNDTWGRFIKKDYGPKHAPDSSWHVDVNAFRSRERSGFLGVDVVFGPTAREVGGTWIVDQNLPIQYKFETIAGLEPAGVLPIFPNRPTEYYAGL